MAPGQDNGSGALTIEDLEDGVYAITQPVCCLGCNDGNVGDARARRIGSNSFAGRQDVLDDDGRGSVYELELSKLAQSTAHDAKVKQYAEMVVGDHSKADEKFKELAEKYDLTVPTTLSQNDRAALDKVKQLSGPDFDHAYLQQMKLINQEDIKAEQQEISTTSVTRLKSFVQTMQNGDEKHNRDAERISSNG